MDQNNVYSYLLHALEGLFQANQSPGQLFFIKIKEKYEDTFWTWICAPQEANYLKLEFMFTTNVFFFVVSCLEKPYILNMKFFSDVLKSKNKISS